MPVGRMLRFNVKMTNGDIYQSDRYGQGLILRVKAHLKPVTGPTYDLIKLKSINENLE